MLAAAIIISTMLMPPIEPLTVADVQPETVIEEQWESLGEYRITTYDQYCNEPQGTQSASGIPLKYGMVAMNGVPFGTKISIEGEVFTVVDRCGRDDTVDIWIDNDSGRCTCDTLMYKGVSIVND